MAQIQTSEKAVTYTLQLRGSDDLTYTASLKDHRDWLWTQLGIWEITSRINKLESRIDRLEAPARQQKIFDLLKNETSARTLGWIQRRLSVSYSDVYALIQQSRLESIYNEAGHSHQYRAKKEKA